MPLIPLLGGAGSGMSGDGRSTCISNSVLPELCLHHISNIPSVEANAAGEILHSTLSCRHCKIPNQMADIAKDGESGSGMQFTAEGDKHFYINSPL